jgi:hypothetical protein
MASRIAAHDPILNAVGGTVDILREIKVAREVAIVFSAAEVAGRGWITE